jgi:hypothetical protein
MTRGTEAPVRPRTPPLASGTALLLLMGGLAGCDLVSRLTGGLAPTGPDEGSAAELAGSVEAPAPEVEPNDDAGQALALTPGAGIAGHLSPGDVDVLRVAGADAVAVAVEVLEGTVVLDWVDAAAGLRHRWTLQAPARWAPAALAAQGGRLLELRGEGRWHATLGPVPGEPPCGTERPQDTDPGPAGVVFQLPGRGSGCLQQSSEVDRWQVEPGEWAAHPVFGVAVSGVPGVQLQLRVLDAAGALLAETMGAAGEDLLVPNVGSPLHPGAVTLEVQALAGVAATTPYVLDLRRPPPLLGAIEVVPNDVPAAATLVTAAGVVNGFLHRSGDVDHYRMQWPDTQVVRMRLESPPGVDLQILVDDGAGFGDTVIDQSGPGGQESLCTLRVGPEAPLNFAVAARGPERVVLQPYLLHFEPFVGTDFEVEPNDRLEDLAPPGPPPEGMEDRAVYLLLAPGLGSMSASGHIFPASERDLVAVDIARDPSSSVTFASITLRLDPVAPVDLVLELLDARGAVVARSDGGRAGMPESISADLAAGRYYARITQVGPGGCEAPWRLTVDQTRLRGTEERSDGALLPPPPGEENPELPDRLPPADTLREPTAPGVGPTEAGTGVEEEPGLRRRPRPGDRLRQRLRDGELRPPAPGDGDDGLEGMLPERATTFPAEAPYNPRVGESDSTLRPRGGGR